MTEIDTASRAHENLDREVYTYRPPENFPNPTSHPEFHHRWLALEVMGQPNSHIMHKRIQEGYVICNYEDEYPELGYLAPGGRAEGPIRHSNHVLGRIHRGKAQARRDYYKRKSLGAAARERAEAQSEYGMHLTIEDQEQNPPTGSRRVAFGFDDP